MSVLKQALAALALSLTALLPLAPAHAQQPGPVGKYSTKAALIPIGENPEKPSAELFYVAYTLDGADPTRRPITFCFNGGPGASSVYLHMAALGPMTVELRPDGSLPPAPAKLAANPHTWLHFTDLVFIDPVQTGYSRALPGAKGEPGNPAPFFEAEADLRSIAQFIRRYLDEHKRWASPKAIAGESYGGLRVAALTRLLMEEYDINLNRAVLISPLLKTAHALRGAALRPGRRDDEPAQPGGHRGGAPARHAARRPGPAAAGPGRRGAVCADRVRHQPRPPGARVPGRGGCAVRRVSPASPAWMPSWWHNTAAAWLRTST
jgi:hypothetical protein